METNAATASMKFDPRYLEAAQNKMFPCYFQTTFQAIKPAAFDS